jgi:hypothetical protein
LVLDVDAGHGAPEDEIGHSDTYRLLDRDTGDAGSHHAEGTRSAQRYIDNPAPNEWSAIIDAALYGMTGVLHRDDAPERSGTMGAGHLTPVAAAAMIGSKAGFSFCRLGALLQQRHHQDTRSQRTQDDRMRVP